VLGLRQLGTISELHVLSNACCLLMHLFFHGLRSRILTLVILNFFSWGIIGFFAGFNFLSAWLLDMSEVAKSLPRRVQFC